jgi:hypothetical protein
MTYECFFTEDYISFTPKKNCNFLILLGGPRLAVEGIPYNCSASPEVSPYHRVEKIAMD